MILYLIFSSILLEPGKTELNCLKNQFTCKNNKQCISILEYCDNKRDCKDGSDELNCSIDTCVDKVNINDCLQWSASGYCKSSYKYMLENCIKSCDLCYITSNTYTKTTTTNTYTTLTNTYTTKTNTLTTLTKTYTNTLTTLTKTYTNTLTTLTKTYTNTLTKTYTNILTNNTLTNNTLINTYQNSTVINKSKKKLSSSTIIIIILVICIILMTIFIRKRKIVNENILIVNKPNIIENTKPIILDSVYNSMPREENNENNEYLEPVIRNTNYIEEAVYAEII